MNIGEASAASGVSAKMIRYYEKIGLLGPVARTESGYRVYTETDVHTLRFIRRARDLGFGVEGIAELLALWRDRSRKSADVKRLAQQHLAVLERKIAELQSMADTLRHLVSCCAGDDRPECPILADIEAARPSPGRHAHRFGAPGGR